MNGDTDQFDLMGNRKGDRLQAIDRSVFANCDRPNDRITSTSSYRLAQLTGLEFDRWKVIDDRLPVPIPNILTFQNI